MYIDLRGNPVSQSDALVLQTTELAITQFLKYQSRSISTIESAIARQPDFVFGHIVRAMLLMLYAEPAAVESARQSNLSAMQNIDNANDRERALLAASQMLVGGQWHSATSILDRLLVEYPTDIFTLRVAHQIDYYLGDYRNLRNRVARVMPHWHARLPGYSFLLGCYAAGLFEMNQHQKAEELSDLALALAADDVWAARTKLQVMDIDGRFNEGINLLETMSDCRSPVSLFAHHHLWHLAQFYLEQGDYSRTSGVLNRYPELANIGPLDLGEMTSILWRLHLESVDVAEDFVKVASRWKVLLKSASGYYAFNNINAAFAFTAINDHESLTLLKKRMQQCETGLSTNTLISQVGLALVTGLNAYARGKYTEMLRLFESVRDTSYCLGGSQAQHEILSLTLIDAALRLGDIQLAEHYISERTMNRENSLLSRRLINRARGCDVSLKKYAA